MLATLFSKNKMKKKTVGITIHKREKILIPGLQQLKVSSFPQICNTKYTWLDIMRGLQVALFFTTRYQRTML